MSEYADSVRLELHGSTWLDPPVNLEAAAGVYRSGTEHLTDVHQLVLGGVGEQLITVWWGLYIQVS